MYIRGIYFQQTKKLARHAQQDPLSVVENCSYIRPTFMLRSFLHTFYESLFNV